MSLTLTELRYLLAFGREKFSSYSEWTQSDDYVMNDTQLEKRLRNKTKGLVEIAGAPEDEDIQIIAQPKTKRVVQFIHQTVRDFLFQDGFKTLRGCATPNDAAVGNEFLKVACFNYMNTSDLQSISVIDFRFYSGDSIRRMIPTLSEDHPLLMYAVDNLFPHAALAEENGILQDNLRSHMCDENQAFFERWRYLARLISMRRFKRREVKGDEQPLYIFAQCGLLAPGIRSMKVDVNCQGGLYRYPLLAAVGDGHRHAVRYLLNLGADLQVSTVTQWTAYHIAASLGHVEILKMLLEHPRSAKTLEQRIDIASAQRSWYHNKMHQVTTLLIPEDTIPLSAIDTVCRLVFSLDFDERLGSLILDKCEVALLRHRNLWYTFVRNPGMGLRIIKRLLNDNADIEVCEELLDALDQRNRTLDFPRETEEIAMILFERYDLKMTENFVSKILLLTNSSQLLDCLASRGIELSHLHYDQVMSALSNGSLESVAYFIQHAPADTSSDEMLLAVLQNKWCADQAVRILLGLRNIDPVDQEMMTLCLQGRRCSLTVLKAFEDRWGPMTFSKTALATGLSNEFHDVDVIKFIIGRCEPFSLTEDLVRTALAKSIRTGIIELLLLYDPKFNVEEDLIADTVVTRDSHEVLESYARHGNKLMLTDKVVRAAGCVYDGAEALEIISRHTGDAKISETMILEAARSYYGSFLIAWMLESDPSINMQEDFLIETASNPYQGSAIFEAFHYKGRISISNPHVAASHPPAAKRHIISSNRSPSPPRGKETKSVPITRRVIEAAAANVDEYQRRNLLSLFQKWNVLTDDDVALFPIGETLPWLSSNVMKHSKMGI